MQVETLFLTWTSLKSWLIFIEFVWRKDECSLLLLAIFEVLQMRKKRNKRIIFYVDRSLPTKQVRVRGLLGALEKCLQLFSGPGTPLPRNQAMRKQTKKDSDVGIRGRKSCRAKRYIGTCMKSQHIYNSMHRGL